MRVLPDVESLPSGCGSRSRRRSRQSIGQAGIRLCPLHQCPPTHLRPPLASSLPLCGDGAAALLADGSEDQITRLELQEATLSGFPLGQALVERLEKVLNRRLHRGKAGRPPKQRADSAQGSFFSGRG
jgi:hypothetical protein